MNTKKSSEKSLKIPEAVLAYCRNLKNQNEHLRLSPLNIERIRAMLVAKNPNYWATIEDYYKQHEQLIRQIDTLLKEADAALEHEESKEQEEDSIPEPTTPTFTPTPKTDEPLLKPIYAELTEIHEPPKEKTTIVAKELVGRSYSTSNILERILLLNCKNDLSNIDYNRGGTKGHTTKPLTPYFCDNFLLSCVVLASNCNGKICNETSTLNKLIRQFLDQNNIPAKGFKAIDCVPYKPSDEQIFTYRRKNYNHICRVGELLFLLG